MFFKNAQNRIEIIKHTESQDFKSTCVVQVASHGFETYVWVWDFDHIVNVPIMHVAVLTVLNLSDKISSAALIA